jgi:hypothetical protein
MKKLLLSIVLLSSAALYGQNVVEKGKIEEMARLDSVFIQTEDVAAHEIITNALLSDGRLKIVKTEEDAQVIIKYTGSRGEPAGGVQMTDKSNAGQMQVMIRVGIDSPEKKTRRLVWASAQKQDGRGANSQDKDPAQVAVTKFISDLNKVKNKKGTNVRDDPYKILVQ